jgi:OTU domain-containing protein 6
VQALKKSVTKGDKKRKKEIDAQIEAMEQEFEEKCSLELAQLESTTTTTATTEKAATVQLTDVKDSEAETTEMVGGTNQKMSKAQKRREKKEKEDQERAKLIAHQEIENLKGPAHIELSRIKEKLKKMGLEIKEVSSDGNCMFYAVSDQLRRQLNVERSVKELRELTSEYMLRNAGEFGPFMCSEETGDPYGADEYRRYCERMRECAAPVWGSMTELRALSDVLGVRIEVVQAEGAEILVGGGEAARGKLVVTYHRRMFGSGEHYNSTCGVRGSDEF